VSHQARLVTGWWPTWYSTGGADHLVQQLEVVVGVVRPALPEQHRPERLSVVSHQAPRMNP